MTALGSVDSGPFFSDIFPRKITNFARKLGLDYEKIVEDYCGGMQTLGHDILAFPGLCPLDDIRNALEQKDVTAVHKAAHRMRKAAEKLSLDEIARLSRKLEEASIDRAHSLLEPLGKEISASDCSHRQACGVLVDRLVPCPYTILRLWGHGCRPEHRNCRPSTPLGTLAAGFCL